MAPRRKSSAAKASTVTNGTQASTKPFELAIALPQSPGTRIHAHITISESTVTLFLTSSSMDAAPGGAAMGSFVYAMPDRYNPTEPLSTPLYTVPSSLDFATRMAKVLVRRTKRVCYVGSSINLAGAAGGGTVDEEMEAFRAVVDVVIEAVARVENRKTST